MEKLYLALGSNLGDRGDNIDRALELLDDALNSRYVSLSPVLETKALGFSGNDFLNCIVVYSCDSDPFDILDICKGIERKMGRTDPAEYDEKGNRIYHDRIIDIDILMYGDRRICTERLTIPHPQVETRPYIKELLLLL